MILLIFTILSFAYSKNISLTCNQTNQTLDQIYILEMMERCSDVELLNVTIKCDQESFAFQSNTSLVNNGSINLTNVTILCESVYISSKNIIISNIVAQYQNELVQFEVETNFMWIIGEQSITLGSIDASEFTFFMLSDHLILLKSSKITMAQIAVYTTQTIEFNDIHMNLARISCTPLANYTNESSQAKTLHQNLKNSTFLFAIQKSFDKTKVFLEIVLKTNFTGVFISMLAINIKNGSMINGSQLGFAAIYDIHVQALSTITTTGMGCRYNAGLGHGPQFYQTDKSCQGNGGSNAGYGGIGFAYDPANQLIPNINNFNAKDSQYCLFLANVTRYRFNLYPYGYTIGPLFQGSGGSIPSVSPKLQPSGGGAILISSFLNLTIDGSVLADGLKGIQITTQNITSYSGAGSGGSIDLSYAIFRGIGNISARGGDSADSYSAGEGSGGFIKLFSNISYIKANLTNFTGTISNTKGLRNLSSGLYQFSAQNGTLQQPWCPPFLQLNENLQCVPCNQGYYKLTWVGNCLPCLFLNSQVDNTTQDVSQLVNSTFCSNYAICPDPSCKSYAQMQKVIFTDFYGIGAFLLMVLVLITGYMIRRAYKKREMADDKVFDFEKATQEIVSEKIITQALAETNSFQLGDLLYHAHRINIIGNNSFSSQWTMHPDPPENMVSVIDKEEYSKFIYRFNKLARWNNSENIFLNILGILCYPLYWVIEIKIKKKKYQKIEEFVTKTDIRFWKNIQLEQNHFAKIKITKSADYTLLYLDVFNYKNADTKYLLLNCPYIIYLSGEGNFLRPFYICESDTFLVSLFFAVNQKSNIMDEDRYNILENLVDPQERRYNSKRIHRFMKKFNKISMTLDYGSRSSQFYNNTLRLHDYIVKWNLQFFQKYNLKIDLLVLQTPLDYSHHQQTITVLENKDSRKFEKFMLEIHNNVNFQKTVDVKFGVFIYNTQQDPEDVDEVLLNQKMSFDLDHSRSSIPLTITDSIEFDPEQLKEQFIQKDSRNTKSSNSGYSQPTYSQTQIKPEIKRARQIVSTLYAWRCLNYLRYLLMSHKYTMINKVNLSLILCIFVFLDYTFTVAIFANFKFFTELMQSQILFWPYSFVMIISPISGTLWLTTQSYGFLKVFLILNSMSMINLAINLIMELSLPQFSNPVNHYNPPKFMNPVIISLEVIDFIYKILISYAGTRIISMNIKLNKLSQKT